MTKKGLLIIIMLLLFTGMKAKPVNELLVVFPGNFELNSWWSYSWIKIFFTDGTPPYYLKTNNLYVEFRDGGEEVRTYWDFAADNGNGGRGAYVTNQCYKI